MSEFDFNSVQEHEAVQLPEMLEKDVFRNQTTMIDPLIVKQLTPIIIGAGSVGSNLVYQMNKFGFSSFIIYDFDVWETHNSASSVYPYKFINTEIKPRCSREWDTWSYYPAIPSNRNESFPAYSLFKVDLLEEEIRRNDPNIYWEAYRLPFGATTEQAFTKFNQSVSKMGAREIFTNEGAFRLGSDPNYYQFEWNPKVTPDFMVLTTDSLLSRARSVWTLRNLFRNNALEQRESFPVIDIRTLDTTKGEILIFDLMNNEELFDWFNYSIPVNRREPTFESLNEKLSHIDHLDEIPFITASQNLCGDKMSVVISSQVSLMAINIITNIIKSEVDWSEIPKLYLFNTNPLRPYISSMERILNE